MRRFSLPSAPSTLRVLSETPMGNTPPSALTMATMGIASALGSICVLLQSNVCHSLRAVFLLLSSLLPVSLSRMLLALLTRNGGLLFLALSCESDFWTMTFCLASPPRLHLQRYAFFGKRSLFAHQFYHQIVEAIARVYLQASFLVFRSAKKWRRSYPWAILFALE